MREDNNTPTSATPISPEDMAALVAFAIENNHDLEEVIGFYQYLIANPWWRRRRAPRHIQQGRVVR